MDKKEPIKKTTDELENADSDDPEQIGASNDDPNPPVEKKDVPEEPTLKEPDPILNLYIPGPLSDVQAKKLNPTPKKNKGSLHSNASVDSYGTEESESKSESPKTSSEPSRSKSTESSLTDQPSTSGQNPTGASSFDTEENFSEPEDQGSPSAQGKAIKQDSDLGESGTPTASSVTSGVNNPESSGVGSSFHPSVVTSPSGETSKASSVQRESPSVSSEGLPDPRPVTPPPVKNVAESAHLPADAIEMDEVNVPPPPPPPGGPPPPPAEENPLPPPAVLACCPHCVTRRVQRNRNRMTLDDYLCMGATIVLCIFVMLAPLSPFIYYWLKSYFGTVTSETPNVANATNANQTINNATYSNGIFSNESYANETFNESYSNETFSNASYANATYQFSTSGLNDYN